MTQPGQIGIIYVIHFHQPFKHAKHYVGWSRAGELGERLKRHRKNRGSRLLAALNRAGIGWEVVLAWRGTRDDERLFKKRKYTPRKCPICKEAKRNAKTTS